MHENQFQNLSRKINDRSARVGVIGLGYVGLPLALEFAKSGYDVYGIDLNEDKISQLKQFNSYISDVHKEELVRFVGKNFYPTTEYSYIQELDCISICVPTPLTKSQEPDMSFILSALEQIKKYVHPGILITLESTTYPGTTEEIIQAELENEGYYAGENYFLCFSPERVDPGNKKFNTKNTPKVIGGVTKQCTNIGTMLYEQIIDRMVPVSSPKVAEMSKLLENTFRSVNIAFINEMAMLCDKLGIDVWETIEAASTKPFGYMPFTPGPGIGGHCIPLDPMYLAWKAKGENFYSRYIDLAQEINKSMPNYVIGKVAEALNAHTKPINGSKVLILGMAYKPNINDLRESPGLEIYELLKKKGAKVFYHDPHAQSFLDNNNEKVNSIDYDSESLLSFDAVIMVTNHSFYNLTEVFNESKIIIDTRNAFKDFSDEKIYKIGDTLNNNSEIVFS
ncbi:nucleotide sugar dehydrogenase [Halobacillus litoralis]|uniref:nucleotide sugar dehydrogenase n=1 Tax=Halobacillus litoralis TaxID=45668 RepID=UPI001CD485A9|nr:nucleotide sugar dehydrogenase [Halobacillus litoralis]MCA0970977.1 nucleotide sugar dehydrogenase [Halobacillus litoralis]